MSFQSGARAAARLGIATSGMQMGPRGGRFYINAHGHKVYGIPPVAHERMSAGPSVPLHLTKGSKAQADLDEEGWVTGTVMSINPRKKTVKMKLADGSWIEAPFDSTRPHGPVPPPRTPKASGSLPPHAQIGHHVEVDVEGEGWLRGHVHKVLKGHIVVELEDGTFVKSPFDASRAVVGGRARVKTLESYANHVKGSTDFRESFRKAIEVGGFGPFLDNHKLTSIEEGLRSKRALGMYTRRGGFVGLPLSLMIRIKGAASLQQHHARDNSRNSFSIDAGENQERAGRHVWTVKGAGDSFDHYRQAVMIHELSHHLHLHGSAARDTTFTIVDGKIVDHFREVRMKGTWAPSKYSLTNPHEWFAEAHTAYVLHRDLLKKNDPVGYEIVRHVRDAYGMGE